jgi:hypothetical protein
MDEAVEEFPFLPIGEDRFAQLAAVDRPVFAEDAFPEMANSSKSIRTAPFSASIRATVDLPEAIPPVRPTFSMVGLVENS